MKKFIISVTIVFLFALTSPLLAKLPSYFDEDDKLNREAQIYQGTVTVPLHSPFDDMSDREYLHLTEQGPYSTPTE